MPEKRLPSNLERLIVGSPAKARLNQVRDGLPSGDWVCFVGAGLSQGAGLPDWSALVHEVVRQVGLPLPQDVSPSVYPRVMSQCEAQAALEGKAGAVREIVASLVCRGDEATTRIHQQLVSLPFDAFLTTNFDRLLANAHATAIGVQEPRTVIYPDLDVMRFSGRRLVHLHGICLPGETDSPKLANHAVLMSEDYDNAYGVVGVGRHLAEVFAKRNVLFIGASLEDRPLRHALENALENMRTLRATLTLDPELQFGKETLAFAVAPPALLDNPDLENADFLYELSYLQISPIWYWNPDGRHEAVTDAIDWLAAATPPVAGVEEGTGTG